MRIQRYYESAVMAVLFSGSDKDLTDAAVAVENVASELDSIQRRLLDNSERMEVAFRDYAVALRAGRTSHTPPTAFSAVREIEQDAARLEEKREQLRVLVRALYGSEKAKAVFTAVAESFKNAVSQ